MLANFIFEISYYPRGLQILLEQCNSYLSMIDNQL